MVRKKPAVVHSISFAVNGNEPEYEITNAQPMEASIDKKMATGGSFKANRAGKMEFSPMVVTIAGIDPVFNAACLSGENSDVTLIMVTASQGNSPVTSTYSGNGMCEVKTEFENSEDARTIVTVDCWNYVDVDGVTADYAGSAPAFKG